MVEAETLTSATVVVTGVFVTVFTTVIVDRITTVEVAFRVVVEVAIERHEQADEIFEAGKLVR